MVSLGKWGSYFEYTVFMSILLKPSTDDIPQYFNP